MTRLRKAARPLPAWCVVYVEDGEMRQAWRRKEAAVEHLRELHNTDSGWRYQIVRYVPASPGGSSAARYKRALEEAVRLLSPLTAADHDKDCESHVAEEPEDAEACSCSFPRRWHLAVTKFLPIARRALRGGGR